MNPLTLVKNLNKINAKEAALGISDEASWHAKYKDSAYVYVGGIPYDLTEGDLLAVFSQYGEIVDVNLVRDKGTGKSKGFAFVAYEDQRSTTLAVDNLNGAQVLGRTIRVDHVSKYKKKEEEDEETAQRKREERGVCRAFQRGECNRGDACKFSHDERRAANTGWGHEEDRRSRWLNDKFEGSTRNERLSADQEGHAYSRKDSRGSRAKDSNVDSDRHYERGELGSRDRGRRDQEKTSRRDGVELNSREHRDRRDEKRSRKYESESYPREDRDNKGKDRRSARDRESSPDARRTVDESHRRRSYR